MCAFGNTWHFTVKIWQAPGEHVAAKDLRNFFKKVERKRSLSHPAIAVGYDDSLKNGEVRVILVTYYNEHCFPPGWELDWIDKRKSLSIAELREEAPNLKNMVEKCVYKAYREDYFQSLIRHCLEDLNYDANHNWKKTREALDYFKESGSDIRFALCNYAHKVVSAADDGDARQVKFFLRASLWALKSGSFANADKDSKTVLDVVNGLLSMNLKESNRSLALNLRDDLLAKGALTYVERLANTDYFRELELLKGM